MSCNASVCSYSSQCNSLCAGERPWGGGRANKVPGLHTGTCWSCLWGLATHSVLKPSVKCSGRNVSVWVADKDFDLILCCQFIQILRCPALNMDTHQQFYRQFFHYLNTAIGFTLLFLQKFVTFFCGKSPSTVTSLIKDPSRKGQPPMRTLFWSTLPITIVHQEEDNLSTVDTLTGPQVSLAWRFHCMVLGWSNLKKLWLWPWFSGMWMRMTCC